MGFLNNVEKVIKEQGEAGLDHLLYYYGIELEVFRDIKEDEYSRVHRHRSGVATEKFKDIVGMLQGDDYFEADDASSGNFEAGFLYSRDADILVGDTLKIKSEDKKSRRYKIESKISIGLTTEVFTKWKIINLGD